MASVLIVGDDLTGSNGAATGMARRGLRTVTLRVGEHHEEITAQRDAYDAVVVTTDSRHLPAAEAARLTAAAVRAGWPASFVSSRCDSTLRGNVGAQAQAVIDTIRTLTDREVIGLCMPAFPSADRQTVGGLQLMGGARLELTELAHDVRTPMTTSSVAAALTRESTLTCAEIGLETITAGGSDLEGRIESLLADSPDILIGDAFTEGHLDALARAALAVRPDAMWVGIDPGPGSWAIAERMGLTGSAATPPLLAVSGSATELTRTQLTTLSSSRGVSVVRPVFLSGTRRIDVEATAADVLTHLRAASSGGAAGPAGPAIVLLATVLDATDIIDLTEAEADDIPAALGRITKAVLDDADADGAAARPVGGLYTTGGDVTAEVLHGLGGVGIEIRDEVVPLATAGTVVGGPHAGLPIVTKGGLVGGADTACVCLDALADLASTTPTTPRSTSGKEPS
ncbi:four-carbon acid sugar kinase family protein [Brevibacterium yomogidense]|uniref:four-carbon acid sugar kinase family protein n=1 Tax=Brevibacterium yomogidense TaxID=946573 RepID=UPI0018DF5E76|nr:four-carbon acid sugar kinase family protein [Brevibacterium yomogidense]